MVMKVFKTYKEDFPLICLSFACSCNLKELDEKFKSLILDLSNISAIPEPFYIATHTDEDIPNQILEIFKGKNKEFVAKFGSQSNYTIPIIWIAIYNSTNSDVVKKLEEELNIRNIRYYVGENNISEYHELDEENTFLEFLQQTTKICFDLLNVVGFREKLMELTPLHTWNIPSQSILNQMLLELKTYIFSNSKYYRDNIAFNNEVEIKFWCNFTKIINFHPWSHFLFNICRL